MYLALFLLSFSLNNFTYLTFDLGIRVTHFGWYYLLHINWALVIPVLLLGFVKSLLNPTAKPYRLFFWLALPFLLNVTYELVALLKYVNDQVWLAHFLENWGDKIFLFWEFTAMFLALGVLVYILWWLRNYEKTLLQRFSNVQNRSIKWLRNLLLWLVVLWLLWLIPYLYEYYSGELKQVHHYPLWIGMSVLVYWIGYSAYLRSDVFEASSVATVIAEEPTKEALSDKTDHYHKALLLKMKSEAPYKQPDLSLHVLADSLGISAGYLSQIINRKEGLNFYDFVNQYRVNEVKRLLQNPSFDHYSFLALALEAGFNAKSTFNTAFKKHAGQTPSQYKKEVTAKSDQS